MVHQWFIVRNGREDNYSPQYAFFIKWTIMTIMTVITYPQLWICYYISAITCYKCYRQCGASLLATANPRSIKSQNPTTTITTTTTTTTQVELAVRLAPTLLRRRKKGGSQCGGGVEWQITDLLNAARCVVWISRLAASDAPKLVGWLPPLSYREREEFAEELGERGVGFVGGAARGGENLVQKGCAKKAAKSNARLLLYITSCRVGGPATTLT